MTKINIAAHREDHPSPPYVYYDDVSDPRDPGWVLRYEDNIGQVLDEILPTIDPDDAAVAVEDAHLYLNDLRR